LLGVLTASELDDGRGHARTSLFKFKHELETGRTSAVGMEIMGFDARGEQVVRNASGRKFGWEDITNNSAKVPSLDVNI
jgi:GTPase